MDKISQTITHLFEKHRIVFWCDAKQELRQEFESLLLPGVQSIELGNNEYAVKHRILRESPNQKFLLYRHGPEPTEIENWLLDVQLAQGVFNADQISMWLAELGLGPDFYELAQEHAEFFKSAARRDALKTNLTKDDSPNQMRIKMLSVCVGSGIEARIENILETLLDELSEGRTQKINLIQRVNLDDFFWRRLGLLFAYQSEMPSLKDFSLTLFQSCYALSLEEESTLTQDALVFLKRWKDSRRHHQAFASLSAESAAILNIEDDLQNRDYRDLIEIDYFSLIDQRILQGLVNDITRRTIPAGEVENLIWRRRGSRWYENYQNIYEALGFASRFIAEFEKSDLNMRSLADGVQKYTTTWHRLDYLYRKFIYHLRASKQSNLLGTLNTLIEGFYSNNFLLPLNNHWQQQIDASERWDASPVLGQGSFFEHFLGEYLRANKKAAVIISDALRYEIGAELAERIESENRYTAELTPLLSVLPSYTQLGMADLLPHEKLEITKENTVLVDGQSSVGRDNRAKILNNQVPGGATAIRAADLLSMSREDGRNLFRENQIVYIYHNQIDAIGDKKDTEERAFDAAEDAINELVEMLKKLTSANFTNIFITADHGFIYQNRPLDESEFAGEDVQGEIMVRNRRFVVGKNLTPGNSTKLFSATALDLIGDYQVAIPKSINRLRLKGAGSRFVHGGATLQEIVVPVLKINKKRSDDLSLVDIEVIASSSSTITTGQLSVAFYQKEAVSTKRQPRHLTATIYTDEDVQISDQHELSFDLTSENPRDREIRVRFVLSQKADEANNQTVYLKLKELESGTTHYKEYLSVPYQLRRSFTSDFDF